MGDKPWAFKFDPAKVADIFTNKDGAGTGGTESAGETATTSGSSGGGDGKGEKQPFPDSVHEGQVYKTRAGRTLTIEKSDRNEIVAETTTGGWSTMIAGECRRVWGYGGNRHGDCWCVHDGTCPHNDDLVEYLGMKGEEKKSKGEKKSTPPVVYKGQKWKRRDGQIAEVTDVAHSGARFVCHTVEHQELTSFEPRADWDGSVFMYGGKAGKPADEDLVECLDAKKSEGAGKSDPKFPDLAVGQKWKTQRGETIEILTLDKHDGTVRGTNSLWYGFGRHEHSPEHHKTMLKRCREHKRWYINSDCTPHDEDLVEFLSGADKKLPPVKRGDKWRTRAGKVATIGRVFEDTSFRADVDGVGNDLSFRRARETRGECYAYEDYTKANPCDLVELIESKGKSEKRDGKFKPTPVKPYQVWRCRNGFWYVVGEKREKGGYHGAGTADRDKHPQHICDEVRTNNFATDPVPVPPWTVDGWQTVGRAENAGDGTTETQWWVRTDRMMHPGDLIELVYDEHGNKPETPKHTDTKKDDKTNMPENAKPQGPLEERVVELIHAHSTKVDEAELKAMVSDAVEQNVSTLKIDIPHIKVTHTEDNVHEQFPILLDLIANGERVFLSGPPGSGKTTATEKACEILKKKFFIQGPVADEFRLTGFLDAHGNYQETEVYRWATTENSVLMLDEVDGSFPQPLLFLNMALANGYIAFPGKGKVEIPKGNTVVANGNTWGGGADFDFVGRSKLDAAFINRFPAKLVWDYDAKFEKKLAISANGGKAAWVTVMQKIRDNARKNGIKVHVTPRDTFFYCRCRHRGMTHDQALAIGLLATCKADQRDKLLQGVKDDAAEDADPADKVLVAAKAG